MRHGSRQTIDTLINEEACLLARFLRNEKERWIPRITDLASARAKASSAFLKVAA
jgi:hypothetical protein